MSLSSERFTTGSFGLDLLMDGGWKRGAINEIWGEPGSGKTALAKMTLQRRHPADRDAMWINLGPGNMVGRDPSLLYSTPSSAEAAFYIMEHVAKYGYKGNVPSFIIVDDANHLVREAELNGDPDYVPHPQREYKDELTSLKGILPVYNVGVIFISQPRNNQRPPIRGTGISEKAAERVSLKVIEHKQNDEILVRATHKATDKSTTFWIVPGLGIDRNRELVQYGLRYGYIDKRGSRYYLESRSFHGINDMIQYMEESNAGYRLGREILKHYPFGKVGRTWTEESDEVN
jgi:recombination protein RecA